MLCVFTKKKHITIELLFYTAYFDPIFFCMNYRNDTHELFKTLMRKRENPIWRAQNKKCFEICVFSKQKISSFFTKFSSFFPETFFYFHEIFFFFFRLHYPMTARRRIRPFSKFDREKTRRGMRTLMRECRDV